MSEWIGSKAAQGEAGAAAASFPTRILHAAIAPSLSPAHVSRIAELEGICGRTQGAISAPVMPEWVRDAERDFVAVGAVYLPLAIAALIAAPAVCRLACARIAARGSGPGHAWGEQ